MFLNALKNNNFLSYFYYLLLAVGFGISVFQSEVVVNDFAFIDLSHFIGLVWLYRVMFLIFWLTSVFWVNRLMVKYKILDFKGGLPVFLYLLMSFAFWQSFISLDILLAILFLLFLLEQLMIIYQNQGRLYQSMNIGLLFGCAAFFYFPLLLIFPWAIFALSVYKTMKWRDYVFPIFGAIIPFYLYSTFQFFNSFPNKLFTQNNISFEIPHAVGKLFQRSSLFVFTAVILLLIVFNSYVRKRTQTLKNRVFHDVVLLLFLGAIVISFFGANSFAELSFLLFPLTFLGAMYFDNYKKKWFFDFLVILFFVFYFI
jgi:hypothetical protein